jgi:hypothetical protein
MSTWFTSHLGDAMLVGESLDQIEAFFSAECKKAGDSGEMAVFIRHESEGRLHCEVKVYFSPATAIVAEAVCAVPCKKPSPVDLGLLCGSEESWSVLFP